MSILFSVVCAIYGAIAVLFTFVPYADSVWIVIPLFFIIFISLNRINAYALINKLQLIFDQKQKNDRALFARVFILVFFIVFSAHTLYWLAYYPGGFNLDALGQWDQIHGIQGFNDWHPVINTLLYWLMTRLSDSLSFCIFCQIVMFSLVISLLLSKLWSIGLRLGIVTGVALFVGANPAIALCTVSMTKDVFFTIFVAALYTITIDVYLNEGVPLNRAATRIGISISLLMITLMRHNGMFFSIPYLVLLFVLYKNKRTKATLSIIVSFSIGIALVRGCLFPLLQVQPHENVVGEAAGVPMAIMANALVYDESNCPEDVKSFLYEIADDSQWRSHYIVGEWDSCKWEFGGTELLQNTSLVELARLTSETIRACPQAAYVSLIQNTRVMWQVLGTSYWSPLVYVEESEYGIADQHVPALRLTAEIITERTETFPIIRSILWNVGLYILLFLFFAFCAVKKGQLRKLLLAAPLITYTWGTTCLLCGPSFRYFYVILVVAFPLLAVLILDTGPVKSDGTGGAEQS